MLFNARLLNIFKPFGRMLSLSRVMGENGINLVDDRWKEAYCRSLLTAAHIQLRYSSYAAAWAEGQTMPLEQAIQLALTFELIAIPLFPANEVYCH